MKSVLQIVLLITQYVAIFALFFEVIYISFQKPSKFQIDLILLLVSTLIMLIGYSLELHAKNGEAALNGTAVSYLGKPFALIMSLIFVADFSGKPLKKRVILPLAAFCLIFPIIVMTNGTAPGTGHHLYYATVEYDPAQVFSPLVLTHGPIYYVYTAFLLITFLVTLFYILRELKGAKDKGIRSQLAYLLAMMVSTIAGYAFFLSGTTQGYDTTITGAAIGSACLTVLFFRFKLFDSLTLAKEHALEHASTGLLVVNERKLPVYTNAVVDRLLQDTFTVGELQELPDGKQIIEKGHAVYEISKSAITKKGVFYGQTIEIADITSEYNYNVQLRHDVEERTEEIRSIQRSVTTSFAGIVEARDHSTGVHIKRLGRSVELIARDLLAHGAFPEILSESFIALLVRAAALHDIGKLSIPDSVLLKPGRLTPEEFAVIQTHSSEGARIIAECLGGVESPEYVRVAQNIANFHHEKWNGSGYPEHLSENGIPLEARIVAVADVYDAVRSERCYKPPMEIEEARKVITDGIGTHFDPTVVEAFLRVQPQIDAEAALQTM